MSETKERPILFSGPMVRAILEGRKTVTRRPVKRLALQWLEDGFEPGFVANPDNAMCPYGQPGERLWVRETWARVGTTDPGYLTYRATYPRCLPAGWESVPADIRDAGERWRPSIHMPRAACRILLEITAVRIERLQSITDQQAQAEGIERDAAMPTLWKRGPLHGDQNLVQVTNFPKLAFRSIWEAINGHESWAANPWVWVVEFKRVTP